MATDERVTTEKSGNRYFESSGILPNRLWRLASANDNSYQAISVDDSLTGASFTINGIRPIREKNISDLGSWVPAKTTKMVPLRYRAVARLNRNKIFLNDELVAVSFQEEIFQAIEHSKYIIDLNDNWDDEGSRGYNSETWKRAIIFITNYERYLLRMFTQLATPSIEHGPEGSIDIIWRNEFFRLLVNMPEGNGHATFYGDNRKSNSFKGTLATTEIDSTFGCWLKNLSKS